MAGYPTIFDGHNDVLSRLLGREGGFGGGLFSVYVSADPNTPAPAGLPRVMAALVAAGCDAAALKKLAHKNWLRILGASWKQGRSAQK